MTMMTSDYDGPTVTNYHSEQRKAATDYVCDLCGKPIPQNSQYYRQSWIEDGNYVAIRSHSDSGFCADYWE